MKIYDAVIIGAGMSGLCTALFLKDKNICILERQEKCGKKILLTGNGRCNITNTNMSAEHYKTDDIEKLMLILDQFNTEKEKSFFDEIGLYTKEKNGYVYPVSNQASTVQNVLIREVLKKGVKIKTDSEVKEVNKKDELFYIKYNDEGQLGAKKLYICTGGMAGVYKEKDHNGYGILKKLGHKINPVYPGLVQTFSENDKDFFKEVTGVRCDGRIELYSDGKCLATDLGELQLTEKGLSGIPVFQISRYIGAQLSKGKNVTVKVDFLPEIKKEKLRDDILDRYEKAMNSGLSAEEIFDGILNKKLMNALVKKSHLSPKRQLGAGLTDRLNQLVTYIKDSDFEITGINGFEKAQISVGGVPLSEVNNNLESIFVKNLYILGETLDVAGECGGYNLHFAIASAYASAKIN